MDFLKKGFTGDTSVIFYILTLVLVFIGMQLASIPLIIAAFATVNYDFNEFQKGAVDNFMSIGMNSSLYLFLMIFTFMFALLVLYWCVKYLHKKKFISIITAREKIDKKRIIFAFILWGGVSVVLIIIGLLISPEDYVWNFKPIPFFVLVLVSFLFIPFQTSAEELVFRGYLMQGFAVLTKNRWFPLLITSVSFGLLHWMNPEVDKLGPWVMVFYIGTGLLFGIITLMDEGTELALGLHAANNIVAAFLVTTDWTVFRTDALYVDISEPKLTADMFISVLVFYPIIIFIFSKKYAWNNWKQKLFGKVDVNEKVATLIDNN